MRNSAVIRCAFLIGLTALGPGLAAAQDPVTARVDRIFAMYDRTDSPGCAVGVYRDGSIVYARGYGMANVEAGVPIGASTVFDIGSTSKQFTAASILLLAQQGRLSVDDDVRRHIPELPEYEKPITIRHLLHHTSGLRDYIGLLTLAGASTEGHTTAQDALDAIVRQKALNFEPGAEYLYSNSGYFLLSQIVERVSGTSMRVFAEENIFGPLGMRATHFHDDRTMGMPTRATGYAPAPAGFRIAMSDWEQTGDGAVNTTVEDLLHWVNNFHEPKVGGETLLSELHVAGVLNNGTSIPYARGLMTENFRGLDAVSHGGSWAGYRAELMRIPAQRFAVATLCNLASANPSALARSVVAVYLEDGLAALPESARPAQPRDTARDAVAVPAAELEPWVGTYMNPATGTIRLITLENGRLRASFGQQRQDLVPQSASDFTAVVGATTLRLLFEHDPAGDARRMRQFADGRETALFVEVIPPAADVLPAYAGSYYSDELNATFTLFVEDGVLKMRRADDATIPLIALPDHSFSSGGDLRLQFSPDEEGRYTRFELNLGRVRGITFRRSES
jgi:CubicO group peptidase (beta-lactamase class C family)